MLDLILPFYLQSKLTRVDTALMYSNTNNTMLKSAISYIDSVKNNDYESNNSCIELEVLYQDIDNKHYREVYKLPFNQIVGTNYSNPPETYMGQIPYYLKEISKLIKNLPKE